jgi:HSP20 family protein
VVAVSRIERFRRQFDDMFDRFFSGGMPSPFPSTMTAPRIESYIEGGRMIVRADLPGVEAKDVEVNVTGDTLTLRARRETQEEKKDRNFLHREGSYGSFERSIALPPGIKREEISASFKNGVLEPTIPLPKESAPRRIPYSSGRRWPARHRAKKRAVGEKISVLP